MQDPNMDPGFRERQGYYASERDPHHQSQQQQQHQLPQQQPQLLPHYAHQLPHHPGLLPPHLQQHQLHQTQPTYVLDQPDHMRGREEFVARHSVPSTVAMQQLIPGSGQVTPPSIHRSILSQYSDHSQPQMQPLDHTTQASYVSSSEQPPTMIDTSATGQAFLSPDSPTPPQGSPEERVGSGEVEMEAANLDQEVRVASSDIDTPKKRAVRIALAETQQGRGQVNTFRHHVPIPDIWKPDLPSGLSLRFSPDGKKIAGVRAERMLQKGAKFGPYNGKLLDEHKGSVKDSAWEICIRSACLYVQGQSKSYNNWMAFIESANFEEEQNLEAYQSYGDIYFRTTRVIEPGSELKVFYSEEYANRVGFKLKLNDLLAIYSKDTKHFNCTACERTCSSAKLMLRHMKIYHKPDRGNEMLPVLTWKAREVMENEENENFTKSTNNFTKSINNVTKSNNSSTAVPLEKPKPKPPAKLATKLSPIVKKVTVKSDEDEDAGERFICTTCGKNFATQGRLAAHETFHEYNTDHDCTICGETFSNSNNLAKHMVSHKDKPHKCDFCGNAFTTRNMLSRHVRLSHTLKYGCRVCEQQFAKKRECYRHEKTHPDWKNFKDLLSDWNKKKKNKKRNAELEGEFDFLPGSHVDVEEEEEEEEEEDESLANSSLPNDMLGKRMNHYDKPRPYKCRYCQKRYLCRKTRLNHEAHVHTKRCPFKCEHCPAAFGTKVRYLEHVKRHENNRAFKCQVCPATFASESALKNHLGEHTGLKPIKCTECGRGFRTRNCMNAHKRRMHKVQPMRYACSFCNKPFSEKGNLIQHERRHKGIRPFVCLVCGRGFTSNYVLNAHSYTHTKEKKFSCPHCDQKFTLNQHLTNHIYKFHGSNVQQMENDASLVNDPPQHALQPNQQALQPAQQALQATQQALQQTQQALQQSQQTL